MQNLGQYLTPIVPFNVRNSAQLTTSQSSSLTETQSLMCVNFFISANASSLFLIIPLRLLLLKSTKTTAVMFKPTGKKRSRKEVHTHKTEINESSFTDKCCILLCFCVWFGDDSSHVGLDRKHGQTKLNDGGGERVRKRI